MSLSPITLFRRSGPDTGYYSDRNDGRAGYRDERGYLSDHSSRGLAPNYRQDSIRSGYISDHESRSGYEHRGEYLYPMLGFINVRNNYFFRPECWNNVEKYRWCSSTGNGLLFISLQSYNHCDIPRPLLKACKAVTPGSVTSHLPR